MRDITIHQYENIDFRIIWVFLTEERPAIVGAARKCLADIESGNDLDALRSPPKRKLFSRR